MKKKKIILTLIIIIVLFMVGGIVFYYYNQEKNMDYKFEDNKLYITLNAKDWIEVPGDFSYTAEHLKEVNGSRYREGTYQIDNNKIVFYKGKTWNDVAISVGPYSDGLLEIYFKNKTEGNMKLKGRDENTIFNYETNDGGVNGNTIE